MAHSVRTPTHSPPLHRAGFGRISNTRSTGLALIALLLLVVQPATHARGPEHPVLAGPGEFDKTPSQPAADKQGWGHIDFESDEGENQPNGFRSVDDPRVAFFDSVGEHLQVDTYGPWADGQGLRIGGNDPSQLIMVFAEPVATLSLDFGNDQPSVCEPGDEAVLSLFRSNRRVNEVTLAINGNGDMDQTVAYAGECFDTATFVLDVSTAGAAEIVDNIQFQTCGQVGPQAIPALSLKGILVLVILVLVLAWRYRPVPNLPVSKPRGR